MSMKNNKLIFLLIFNIYLFNPVYAQVKTAFDPANVQNNFLNVNYFNEIWLNSADINSDDAVGFATRAAAKIEKSLYEEAFNDISAAIKAQPDFAYPHFLKGIYFLNKLSYDSARVAFTRSLKTDSLNTLTLFYLGLNCMFSDDKTTANECFTRINNVSENEYLGYFGLANLALNERNYDESRRMHRKVLKINPGFVQSSFSIGMIDLLQGNFGSCSNYMEQIIQVDPAFAPAYFIKGMIKMVEPAKPDQAILFFNKAIVADPKNLFYLEIRARANSLLDQHEKVYDDIMEILKGICIDKKWFNSVTLIVNDNPYRESYFLYQLYSEYSSIFKKENRTMLMKALWYFYTRENEKAKKELLKVLQTDDNSTLDLFLGLVYQRLGENQAASEYFRRSTIRSPDSYLGFLRSGILNFKTKNYDIALTDLNKVLILNDTILEAYWWRGNTNSELGRIVDAISDLNYYISRDSVDASARFQRASIRVKAKVYGPALKDLNAVLFYNENYTEAIKMKSECLYNLEDYKGVTDFLVKLDPSKVTMEEHRMMGYSYMVTGKYKEASESLSRYISADGLDLQSLSWRGNCYFNMRNYEAAVDDFSRCIMLNSSMGILYYLRGSAYLKMRKMTEACLDFKTAEQKHYDVPFEFEDFCSKRSESEQMP
jgi:tetratricopeptide (TPR) repeat protein